MSGGKFITNKEQILSECISHVLTTTERIDLLVGFFYFSGFHSLSERLRDKHLRVLIGMDTELTIKNKVREIYKIEEQKTDDTKEAFIEQLKNAFNKSNVFDNKASESSMKIFISKIIDRSLEIKHLYLSIE